MAHRDVSKTVRWRESMAGHAQVKGCVFMRNNKIQQYEELTGYAD